MLHLELVSLLEPQLFDGWWAVSVAATATAADKVG